jgi:hypothetical protein
MNENFTLKWECAHTGCPVSPKTLQIKSWPFYVRSHRLLVGTTLQGEKKIRERGGTFSIINLK